MSTDLAPAQQTLQIAPAVYDRAADVPAFLTQIGDAIHRSGIFGTEMPSQGQVLALECMSRRLPPLTLAERYHLIKGKLSMKADAMLGDFRASGGKHVIVERSDSRAAVELSRDGRKHVFELTWADAQLEPFVYVGKEADVAGKLAAGKTDGLKLKTKYSTPRSRAQMLWARVVSDGVRAMAPEIVAGHYTPEEISDFDGCETVVVTPAPSGPVSGNGNGQAAASGTSTAKPEPAPEPAPSAKQASAEQASAEQASAEQAPANESGAEPPVNSNRATPEQIAEAKQLVGELNVAREKLAATLERLGAAKVSDLSREHCEHLLSLLRAERERRQGKNE